MSEQGITIITDSVSPGGSHSAIKAGNNLGGRSTTIDAKSEKSVQKLPYRSAADVQRKNVSQIHQGLDFAS